MSAKGSPPSVEGSMSRLSVADRLKGAAPAEEQEMAAVLPKIAINYVPAADLETIPGIKSRLAKALITVRENSGNLTLDVLETICRRKFTAQVVEMLDFKTNPALSASSSEDEDHEDEDEQPSQAVKDVLRQAQQAPVTVSIELQIPASRVTSPYAPKMAPDYMSSRPVRHAPAAASTPSGWPDMGAIPRTKMPVPTPFHNYDSDDETSHYPLPSRRSSRAREIVASLPKHLTFNGKGNWSAFKLKFTQYARVCEWTDEECMNGLVWCLTDKALDYYTVISGRNETFSYRSLLRRLEERFGEHELPAAAQVRFQQATQNSDESLEEWADRVLTLATRAFQTVPVEFATEQSVSRFCQGMIYKDAGQHVFLKEPRTIQIAVQMLRKYQQVHTAMYGKQKQKKRDNSDESAPVYAVASAPSVHPFMKALEELEQRLQKSLLECINDDNLRSYF